MTSANPNIGKYHKEPMRAQHRRWLKGGAGFFLIANHGVQCIANFVMDYLRHLLEKVAAWEWRKGRMEDP